jgi:CHAT domain-containing protein/tetratricopeptide (TPR) repeat protein
MVSESKILVVAAICFSAVAALSVWAQWIISDTSDIDELDRQVGELYQTGKYSDAVKFAVQALELSEKARGPEHPDTATRASNLAGLYVHTGDYGKAEPLLQRSVEIYGKALGPENQLTALSINNLAGLYAQTGHYAKAESLLRGSLETFEKALGPQHPDILPSLGYLAGFYNQMEDKAKAEPLCRRALEICEKAFGPEHPDTAGSLSNLAGIYISMGDYAKAEPLLQRSLKILEKALGREQWNTALSLNNLALLYNFMGDYATAERLAQRSVEISEKSLGPDHPKVAESLNNLALTYLGTGEYAKAEPLYQRMLTIYQKAPGLEYPRMASALGSLAALYGKMGEYAKAALLYQRSLAICERTLHPESPNIATILGELAEIYCFTGDYAKAEPLSRQSVEICEKTLGPEHPVTARMLRGRALLTIATVKQKNESLALVKKASYADERHLSNMLSFTSEEQRLAFQKTTRPYDLPGTLGDAKELAALVLRRKGVVIDSLLEDRLVAEASADSKQKDVVSELRALKRRLMRLQLETPTDVSKEGLKKRNAEKEELSEKREELEAALATRVVGLGHSRRALSVTVPQVQSVLPKAAALIELVRYSHYFGKDRYEPRYGAIVIGPQGDPGWIPLGGAVAIEKNVALYQKSVRGKTDETTLSTVLKKLHEQLWAPLERALPEGTATVIVSPDAELSFISFATLLTPAGRFVCEKYFVRYAASGRDLLREAKPTAVPTTTMRVFANPDFALSNAVEAAAKTNEVGLRSVEMRDLQCISLPNLPGTEKESVALEELAKKSGWQAQANLGPNATEAEMRKVNSPRILHLATHGFFLPESGVGVSKRTGDAADIPEGKLVNPMHRNGLAMTGAQHTLQAWAKGEVPPIENDGIVTAEEVGGLKLDGTWLVTLSACDTGSGEARTGEGVLGLRRGFIQSGAQNLLMTLWPISDGTTVQIMLDFYDAAFKSGNAPRALANTQRDWLVKLRNERGLLAAVQLAGPFIISSQGKQ